MFLIVSLLCLRAVLAWLIPPVADESYYMVWAQHQDVSYVDHPGMIAWLLGAANAFIGNPLLAARLTSFLCLIGTLAVVYATLRLTLPVKRALSGVVFFLCIPYIFIVGMLMQVEQPLLLFGSMMIFGVAKWLKTEKPVWIYVAALGCGLGFLSKYSIVILAAGLLWVIIRQHKGHLLRSPHVAVSLGLLAVIISPMVWWNMQHHWASFAFHAGRVGESRWFENTLAYVGDQIVYWSPVGLWFAWRARRLKTDGGGSNGWGFLFLFVLVIFGLISIKTKVYAHWTALGLIPFTLWIAEAVPDMKKVNRSMMVFTGIVAVVLLFVSPGIGRKQPEVLANHDLKKQIDTLRSTLKTPIYLYGDSHGSVGILSYYTQGPVYFPRGFLAKPGLWGEKQFALWPQPVIYPGENVIYYSTFTPELEESLKTKFDTVYPLPWKLTLLEDHISQKMLIMCAGAKEVISL
jgi:4-amino-4-deoxy-L-arabinose transferase-like glycosyltransferase